MVKQMPVFADANDQILLDGSLLQELITAVRDMRVKNNLKPKDPIEIFVITEDKDFYNETASLLQRQTNATSVAFTEAPVSNSISLVVQKDKLYIVANVTVDTAAQKQQMQTELTYLQGFLVSVEKKLGNERFMQNAKPDVIASEQKKKEDALAKIKVLEESLSLL
jgi:valyl-tRNA synthetase